MTDNQSEKENSEIYEGSEEMIQETTDSEESENLETAARPKQVYMTDVELRKIQKDLLDYKDKYLRLLAEMENSRKRMQKERQDLTKYAIENIIINFLHPLDNLENALKFAQNMSDEVKNWAHGFHMILTQFKDVLTENGVTLIEVNKNTQFDPHLHEAVEILETDDQQPGTIVEEYVRGYKMGERTIRPARVKVAKPKNKQPPQEKQEILE